jgi:hypothetical protein
MSTAYYNNVEIVLQNVVPEIQALCYQNREKEHNVNYTSVSLIAPSLDFVYNLLIIVIYGSSAHLFDL